MLSLITNTASSIAQRNLRATDRSLQGTLERLSSGLRINKASDDVAAMAIGSRLNAELTALRTVATNTGQAVSLLQIAEGAYARTQDILTRMKSLTTAAANGTLSNTERQLLDVEFQALALEIDRLATDTKFNGQGLIDQNVSSPLFIPIGPVTAKFVGPLANVGFSTYTRQPYTEGGDLTILLNVGGSTLYTGTLTAAQIDEGAPGGGDETLTSAQSVVFSSNGTATEPGVIILTFAAGFDVDAGSVGFQQNVALPGMTTFDFRVGTGAIAAEDQISVNVLSARAKTLGLTDAAGNLDVDITTTDNANLATTVIDAAIDYIVEARAIVGAGQNRIETAAVNLATTIENTEAARSSYLDADIASEITKFTSQQILLQSGISTLAQANQIPQNLLSLFNP